MENVIYFILIATFFSLISYKQKKNKGTTAKKARKTWPSTATFEGRMMGETNDIPHMSFEELKDMSFDELKEAMSKTFSEETDKGHPGETPKRQTSKPAHSAKPSKRSKRQSKPPVAPTQPASSGQIRLRTPADARRAFIYSEIFQRKY